MQRSLHIVCVVLTLAVVSACTPRRIPPPVPPPEPMSLDAAFQLLENRAEWTDFPPIDVPRYPAQKYLKDWVIVLDPGHGGEDGGAADSRTDYKRGPTGVREADMNWRVAVLLKRLLEDGGARIILTRNGDETVSLARRSEIANEANADLFVSIHHNAVGNRTTNYTSVWYHGEVDGSEPDLDVAQAVSLGIGRMLRTEVGKTSPIFSDQLMYKGGFGVLRGCDMPAILCESSFFTHPAEEQRLRDAGYNLREAYGIYLGLCDYAYGGRPTQTLPDVVANGSRCTLSTRLSEGLPSWWGSDRSRILASGIDVRVDGQSVPIRYDAATRLLSAELDIPSGGAAVVGIHHQNMFKHHNWPQRFAVAREGDQVTVRQLPAKRARGNAASQPATTQTRPAIR